MQPPTDVWQDDLLPGERILWTGRPAKWTRLGSRELYSVIFGIVWVGSLLSWGIVSPITHMARTGGLSRLPEALVGLLFLGVGFYISVGRLLVQSNLRRRTRYAVTDQRVLFRTNTGLDAISLDTLPSMATHERSDGGGSITFGDAFEFMDVPKVKEVYQLIVTERDRRRRVT